MSGNSIRAIPDYFFAQCSRLEELYLDDNDLEEFQLSDEHRLTRLKVLGLSGNQLKTVCFVDFYYGAQRLKELNLSKMESTLGEWKSTPILRFCHDLRFCIIWISTNQMNLILRFIIK